MLKNYIKIAWRNILNRKFYTFLNISGLALAISCCIFIYLYTSYNLSFDTYHKNSANIFRLVHELTLDKTEYDKGSSYAEYKAAITEIPQVKQGAFSVSDQTQIINIGTDKHFKEDGTVSFDGADWFKLFKYEWVAGSPAQLDQPYNAVLRQQTAQKYFGNEDPIGKTLVINKQPVKVVGVIADGPYNTTMRSNIYLSFCSIRDIEPLYEKQFYTEWGYISTPHNGFVRLADATEKGAVEKQLLTLEKKYMWKDAYKYFHFKLLPLNETHFDTRYGGVVQRSLLWNLVVIGLLIIAIAVINYINIVVAQQTRRGVEIGTRKVLGGTVRQLFMQFITESLVTTVIAVFVALLLVMLLLPVANNWLFTDAPVHILSYGSLGLYIAVLLIVITIGTGVYPAWLLSRISITRALKNNVLNLPAGVGRKALVIFQNVITQGLIVCTIIIMLQVHFLKNTDVGYDRKMVITIPTGQTTASQKYQLTQNLKSIPGVLANTFCLKGPSSNSHRGATVKYDTREWEKWPARFAIVDSGYCKTFGLQLIAGRNIRNMQPTPEFLINQTMAEMLEGKKRKAYVIGKKLSAGDLKGVIVGVVKDFNVNSLAGNIEPSVLLETDNLQTNIAVKLSANETATVLNNIRSAYQKVLPEQVFSYEFVDKQIAELYQKENIQQKLISLSAMIAITICSLGLLGLVSLIALQRTKEIGIRKVLGASVSQLCLMLSGEFIWMISLAFVIASSFSFWIMHKWLQNFAYRIQIQWWMFALAGLSAIIIAVVSVGFQAIKAAVANPVKSLRSE